MLTDVIYHSIFHVPVASPLYSVLVSRVIAVVQGLAYTEIAETENMLFDTRILRTQTNVGGSLNGLWTDCGSARHALVISLTYLGLCRL